MIHGLRFPQRQLHSLAFGDVPRHFGRSHNISRRVLDRGNGDGDIQATAILAPPNGFKVAHVYTAMDPAQNVHFLLLAFRRNQPGDGLPHHLLRRITKSFSAPWFQLVTMPCRFLPTMASSEDSTIAASCANPASASFRSVTSARMATYWRGFSWSSRNGTMVVATQ